MNLFRTVFILSCFLSFSVKSQDYYTTAQRQLWLSKAASNKPLLIEKENKPLRTVKMVEDATAFQGWKAVPTEGLQKLFSSSFKNQTGTVVDFGEHLTGYFTFTIKEIHNYQDGPLRLKFTFGEVPAEI